MAYVAPPGARYGVARMVEMLSSLHGATAAAFTDERDALRWREGDPGEGRSTAG